MTLFDPACRRCGEWPWNCECDKSVEEVQDISTVGEPTARRTDPVTSHGAAARVRDGNSDLLRAIAAVARVYSRPVTAFEIADRVTSLWPGRWDEGTIRSACAPARGSGLRVVDRRGTSPNGISCQRLTI